MSAFLLRRVLPFAVSLLVLELLLRGGLILLVLTTDWRGCFWEAEADWKRVLSAHASLFGESTEADSQVYEPDPRAGYRLRANLDQVEAYGSRISSNSVGARGAAELKEGGGLAPRRIVAIGDSFTFGEGVDDGDTWPALLAERLSGVEVVNLGASAYAHDQMLMVLEDRGLPLKPDLVILGFFGSDMMRNVTPRFCVEKPILRPADGGWRMDNVPVPAPRALRRRVLSMPALYTVPKALWSRLTLAQTLDELHLASRSVTNELLARIHARTVAAGAELVIVMLPGHSFDARTDSSELRFVKRFAEPRAIRVVNPSDALAARREALGPARFTQEYFTADRTHYSREGYALVADALARALRREPPSAPDTGIRHPQPAVLD